MALLRRPPRETEKNLRTHKAFEHDAQNAYECIKVFEHDAQNPYELMLFEQPPNK